MKEDFLNTPLGLRFVAMMKATPISIELSIFKHFKDFDHEEMDEFAMYISEEYGVPADDLNKLMAYINVFHSEIVYGTKG